MEERDLQDMLTKLIFGLLEMAYDGTGASAEKFQELSDVKKIITETIEEVLALEESERTHENIDRTIRSHMEKYQDRIVNPEAIGDIVIGVCEMLAIDM